MRGKRIDKAILQVLQKEARPMSTHEICLKIGVNWHPVTNHCLRLQMQNRIAGFRVGRMNIWEMQKAGGREMREMTCF